MRAPWIVTGCHGQLGRALASLLQRTGRPHIALGHAELDIGDAAAVARFFAEPGLAGGTLVNAAAFTQVDRCEREPEVAERVNATAPGLLAEACREAGVRMVHLSTDYVFSGEAREPYPEEAPPDPHNVYGRTKRAGEERVLAAAASFLVVRTSWLFGPGRNFIAATLEQADQVRSGARSQPLRVVDDQTGRPTYAPDLAGAIASLLEAGARGLYHVANAGIATWWDLARFCLDETGFQDLAIERISSEALGLPAPRPRWSVLDCSRAERRGVRMRRWEDAVREHLRGRPGARRRAPERAAPDRARRGEPRRPGERG